MQASVSITGRTINQFRRPLFPLDSILKDVSGLLHVDANTGQERGLYASLGLNVLWVEPIPTVFELLRSNISCFPNQRACRYLLAAEHGREYTFHVSNNEGLSPSIFDLAKHQEIWPDVHFSHEIQITATTPARPITIEQIDLRTLGALVLDTQGLGLLVLRGVIPVLKQFRFVKAEVADFESDAGCCQLAELIRFMHVHGFALLGKSRSPPEARLALTAMCCTAALHPELFHNTTIWGTQTVNSGLKLVRSGLLSLGVNVTKRTEPADVLGLIQKLRPLNCGRELIRIGGKGDGGYLIPDDLQGIEYCFSPGVNTVCDFENHLANLRIKSFLADYSVDAPPTRRAEFTFDRKFLGASDHDNFFTLATWKDKYLSNYAGDLILQMDIEGCEYEAILSTPDNLLNQFRIMAIEFHFLQKLFEPFVFKLFSSSFEKILQHFYVSHIHPNNALDSVRIGDLEVPPIMEFTFINKRRVSSTSPQIAFPHKLDADNTNRQPIALPRCWYSQA